MKPETLARKATVFQAAVAKDLFPTGGKLVCSVCDETRGFTLDDAKRFIAYGWPEHCGLTMRLDGTWKASQ